MNKQLWCAHSDLVQGHTGNEQLTPMATDRNLDNTVKKRKPHVTQLHSYELFTSENCIEIIKHIHD